MNIKNKKGWIPDRPDIRDLTPSSLKTEKVAKASKPKTSVDLRESGFLSPVEDQGEIGSCTAHAIIGLLEATVRKRGGKVDLSRRFLYKVTRKLLGWDGDQGAFIRTAMKAAILIGAPPEDQWPYDTKRFDEEPSPFTYALAQNFKALSYLNVGKSPDPKKRLASIKSSLSAGFPVAFGFTVYDTIDDDAGIVSMPSRHSKNEGGHAVLAVGYDDGNRALLFRNSWGKRWGQDGYGWLPYDYVLEGLAEDFWTAMDTSWVDLPAFGDD